MFGVDAFDVSLKVLYLLFNQLADLFKFCLNFEQSGVVVDVDFDLFVFASTDEAQSREPLGSQFFGLSNCLFEFDVCVGMVAVLPLALLAQLAVVAALMGVADGGYLFIVFVTDRASVFLHASLYYMT